MSKTIFITGASSGIGAATARAAVSAGWNVAMMARSEDKLRALEQELGDSALALPGDATELTEQEEAVCGRPLRRVRRGIRKRRYRYRQARHRGRRSRRVAQTRGSQHHGAAVHSAG